MDAGDEKAMQLISTQSCKANEWTIQDCLVS